MAVYFGDLPNQVSEAIESIINQSVIPDQFIIVCDGQISIDLNKVLNSYKKYKIIQIYFLKTNQGRGAARNFAINKSDASLIFIMDADDICLPNRLEKQLEAFNLSKADIIGGIIEEFEQTPGDLNLIRKIPRTHEKILKCIPYKTPFNHVTIMFSKQIFLDVGGYKNLNFVEDWDFAARAMLNGARFFNIQETLVNARINKKRNYNIQYLKEEINLISYMYRKGLINFREKITSSLIRLVRYLIPSKIFKYVNLFFMRKKI